MIMNHIMLLYYTSNSIIFKLFLPIQEIFRTTDRLPVRIHSLKNSLRSTQQIIQPNASCFLANMQIQEPEDTFNIREVESEEGEDISGENFTDEE